MNIKQALKRKNKLLGEISEEFSKALKYNVIEDGNTRPYSAIESIKKWMVLNEELVQLKTKIHIANAPIYEKIFQLSEFKNQVKLLRSLDCNSGKQASGRWLDDKPVLKHAEINVVERDNMVKQLEARIEQLQDELDLWNHTTTIS